MGVISLKILVNIGSVIVSNIRKAVAEIYNL